MHTTAVIALTCSVVILYPEIVLFPELFSENNFPKLTIFVVNYFVLELFFE